MGEAPALALTSPSLYSGERGVFCGESVRMTLVVRVLGLGSMHFAGLVLGGLFVRRLVLAVAPGVWLALEVG